MCIRDRAYGVVKTAVRNRSWTHWAALPGVLPGQVQTPTQPQETPETPAEAVTDAPGSGVMNMKTLRSGSRGTQVKVLQWLLGQNGHDAGTIDGIFGKKTIAAVRAYQKEKGLAIDGVVGKNTWNKLLA